MEEGILSLKMLMPAYSCDCIYSEKYGFVWQGKAQVNVGFFLLTSVITAFCLFCLAQIFEKCDLTKQSVQGFQDLVYLFCKPNKDKGVTLLETI